MGPHPAVAQARACVRRCLGDLEPGDLVLAACSGGADSLALAAALAHEAPRLGLRGGGVTVDHGLQEGSAAQASRVEATLLALGLDPVRQVRVSVPRGAGGPEAAARSARYTALDQDARQTGARAVLLGHSRDDQAETVLLAWPVVLAPGRWLACRPGVGSTGGRCSVRPGPRCGPRAWRCGLRPWDDPHNRDPSYARARVRHQALPALEAALGPGIAEALARTAGQVRDCEVLDDLARPVRAGAAPGTPLAVLATRTCWPGCPRRSGPGCCAGLPSPAAARPARWPHPCRGTGRAGDRMARATVDGPARGRPGARRYGKLLFSGGEASQRWARQAGPPERTEAEGRWTRVTSVPTSKRS